MPGRHLAMPGLRVSVDRARVISCPIPPLTAGPTGAVHILLQPVCASRHIGTCRPMRAEHHGASGNLSSAELSSADCTTFAGCAQNARRLHDKRIVRVAALLGNEHRHAAPAMDRHMRLPKNALGGACVMDKNMNAANAMRVSAAKTLDKRQRPLDVKVGRRSFPVRDSGAFEINHAHSLILQSESKSIFGSASSLSRSMWICPRRHAGAPNRIHL